MREEAPYASVFPNRLVFRLSPSRSLYLSLSVIIGIFCSSIIRAQSRSITVHESNTFGLNFDGNDETYVDISMSFKWSSMDDGKKSLSSDRETCSSEANEECPLQENEDVTQGDRPSARKWGFPYEEATVISDHFLPMLLST